MIRHIGIGSAMKITALVSFIIWAVLGLIGGLCQILFAGALLTNLSSSFDASGAVGSSVAAVAIGYCAGLIGALIGGAILGGLYALVYNIAAGLFGGLEVEVQ